MPSHIFLGIDVGSSAVKAAAVDQDHKLLFSFHEPLSVNDFGDGRVEQDPDEILKFVLTAIRDAKKAIPHLNGIGICCQRSGVAAWRREEVLHPLITWRDTRVAPLMDRVKSGEQMLHDKAGLPLTVHYAALKIALLQKQFPDDFVGTLDAFLCHRLTGEFYTDESSAAGSMLYELGSREWDPELCKLFHCDLKRLPKIRPSIGRFGEIDGTPLFALSGDQQAVFYELGGKSDCDVLSLGTIAAFIKNSGDNPVRRKGFITRVGWSSEQAIRYLLEGTVNSCGATFDLVVNKLKLAPTLKAVDDTVRSARGDNLAFLPFGGTPSPDWRRDLPLVITDWRAADGPSIALAAMECLGSFIAEVILAMRSGGVASPISITGGVSECRYLLEFISSAIECDLSLIQRVDSGAHGAALMAMQAAGIATTCKLEKQMISIRNSRMREQFSKWRDFRDRVVSGTINNDWIFSPEKYLQSNKAS